MPRFRPQLQLLEAREVPALNLLYNGAALTLTGTPTASDTEFLSISNVGGDNYQVTDGAMNLGTYRVSDDIRLRLTRFDCNVAVDVGGDVLGGDVLIDVGAGDSNPATLNRVFVATAVAGGKVAGDVTFRNGSGIESFNVSGKIEIGGDVIAVGKTVADPLAEDSLTLDSGVVVRGDVRTTRVTYTNIYGATVDGDVIANSADSPGGFGVTVQGTVGGDVTVTGGASTPSTPTTFYYSYANFGGTIAGDVTVRVTAGVCFTGLYSGAVGGDFRVTLPEYTSPNPSFRHEVNMFGGPDAGVAGDTTIRSAGGLSADLSAAYHGDVTVAANGPFAGINFYGLVEGDFRYTGGTGTNTRIGLGGLILGDAMIDLGGSAGKIASLTLTGGGDGAAVGGSLTVKSRAGTTTVQIGYTETFEDEDENGNPITYTYQTAGAVGGDLKVDLGDGASTLLFDGAAGSTLGGKLTYTGGSGQDSVTITGQNTFAAKIKTGAGSDTVAFAPDATVGSLDIDFGAGVDTWTPPSLIAFPVKIKNLP